MRAKLLILVIDQISHFGVYIPFTNENLFRLLYKMQSIKKQL